MSSPDTAPDLDSPGADRAAGAPKAARCPHCQTVWQVQPAQWRAWLGWVRCGHCLQPFDAALAQVDDAPALAMPADALGHKAQDDDRQDDDALEADAGLDAGTSAEIASDPSGDSPKSPLTAGVTPPRRGAPPIGGDPAAWPSLDLDEPADSSPADRWLDDGPADVAAAARTPAPEPAQAKSPAIPPATEAAMDTAQPNEQPDSPTEQQALPAPEAAVAEPAFIAQAGVLAAASVPVPPPHPALQRVGRVLVPLLAGLLVGQVVLASRHWQAAWWPSTRQVWLPLCDTLGCSLRPAQDLSAWSLDNTQLSLLPVPGAAQASDGEGPATVDARGQMRFRLEIGLLRTVDAVVEPPALDLTLVGADGQPLTQRVFTAGELGLTRPAVQDLRQTARDGSAILRLPKNLGENIRTWRARLVYPDAP